MTETALTQRPKPAPPPDRSHVDLAGTGDELSDEEGIGRNAAIGATVGLLVVTAGITVAGTVGGIGLGESLGPGAFVGVFGGAGFGFMMGATIPFARRLDARHPPHGAAEAHDPQAR